MLKDEQGLLLDILRESLKGETYEVVSPGNDSFVRMLKLASVHEILPLICETIYQSNALKNNTVFTVYKQHAIINAAMQKIKTAEFLHMYKTMQAQGLDPLVVKGVICQSLYPRAILRTSVDNDLYVPNEQFKACHQFLADYGLVQDDPDTNIDTSHEISYHCEKPPLYIELHRSLFPDDSEAYGSFNRFFEHAAENSIRVQVDDTSVRTLDPTDHLLYLFLHAFKHFLHSGIGIRLVCDIGVFADHYHAEIDWKYIKDSLAGIHALDYARALFKIVDKYLITDAAYITDIRDWDILAVDEEPLLIDILDSGVHGASSLSRLHSSNITLNAVTEGRNTGGVLHSIFLPLKSMEGRYPYLKTIPILLPVAWTQRILGYLKEAKQSSSDDMLESIRIGDERIKLLEQYNIIKNKQK